MENESTNTNANAVPAMLNALLSNPELLKKVGAMLGGGQTAPQGDAATEAAAPSSATAEASASGTSDPAKAASAPVDGLASLFSDPAMMEKLPQIISAMKPLLASMPSPSPKKEEKPSSPALCRDNLLLSLKPFLSPARCEAVDTILRLSKLGSVFKQLQ